MFAYFDNNEVVVFHCLHSNALCKCRKASLTMNYCTLN